MSAYLSYHLDSLIDYPGTYVDKARMSWVLHDELPKSNLTHEGPSIEKLHTKIIFHQIPSILGMHMN